MYTVWLVTVDNAKVFTLEDLKLHLDNEDICVKAFSIWHKITAVCTQPITALSSLWVWQICYSQLVPLSHVGAKGIYWAWLHNWRVKNAMEVPHGKILCLCITWKGCWTMCLLHTAIGRVLSLIPWKYPMEDSVFVHYLKRLLDHMLVA
jgi:hypothetical protein